MRPPMRQDVSIHVPVPGETDKYGRPKTKRINTKARVQFKSSVVLNAKGEETRVAVEVDLPSNVHAPDGSKFEHIQSDRTVEGTIVATEEVLNLSGSRVYYRTAYVDG